MKTLPNKTFTIPVKVKNDNGEIVSTEQTISFAELLVSSVDGVGDGLTISTMRSRISILAKAQEAIDGKLETIELEDAEVVTLKPLVADMKWSVINAGIVAFGDAVEAL